MICSLHCGPFVLSLAQSLSEVQKFRNRDSPERHYDLFQESTRERELMLRVPSVRKEFPVERSQWTRDQRCCPVRESFCRWSWNSLQPPSVGALGPRP